MANDFDQTTAQTQNMDLSVSDAAEAMRGIDLGEGDIVDDLPYDQQPVHPVRDVRNQPRDPATKQFVKDAVDPDAGLLGGEKEPAEEASSVDDEYFELPPEKEGDQPRRLKATEVWEGYQLAQQYRQELEEVRNSAVPPQEFDHAIMEAVNQRTELMRQMEMVANFLVPQEPDAELLNEDSPRHNPQLFYRQQQMYKQRMGELQGLNQQYAQLQQQNSFQQKAAADARRAREQSKLYQFWPEIRDQKEAARTRDDLIRHYGKFGVDAALIGSVENSAFYALAKDALAYRRGLTKQQAAVKVVRAKPKMVRAPARDEANPINSRDQRQAMQRLRQTGDTQDAVAALRGLNIS